MFQQTSDVSHLAPADIVARDAKSYELAGGQTMCIAQVETVGDGLLERVEELREAVSDYAAGEGHRVVALMVTDVLEHGTQLVLGGDVGLAERALGKQAVDGVIDLPGVMSRKKQVAPKLLSAA
jgi:manganese-dependent inorganic pyrophosphatase